MCNHPHINLTRPDGTIDRFDADMAPEALGLKPTKMVRAVKKLEEDGHRIFYLVANQKGTNLQITMKALAPANATFPEVMERRDEIVRLEGLSA